MESMSTTNQPGTLPRVAYFCMEYGLSADLTIYSGGLGVLAGDYMKSAGDMRAPVTGIGLLWREGYVEQTIGDAGAPVDKYVPTSLDALTKLDVEFEVEVYGKTVACTAYKVDRYTTADLFLIEPVAEEHRWITKRLYGGGQKDRLAQEVLLGVGGVRLLRKLGLDVDIYHFNEGHAVFAGLELVRESLGEGADVKQVVADVRKQIVFTTHTPVPAGNEVHPLDEVIKAGGGVGLNQVLLEELGGGESFSMTAAGLRLSHRANGVAQLHGETARTMWKDVTDGAPIASITNGVHAPTWQDARIRAATVLDKSASERRRELWGAHQTMKRELIGVIAEQTGVTFSADRLLIGFARRAATYKRADLIFRDPERLEKLFADNALQLVFSGKAHPRDEAGKAIVTKLVEATRRFPKNVVFLENYNMDVGAALTRGVDVWLNNPRRPMEASGTSGMKAAMNGVPNLSILDGWWPEGCRHGETGWQILARTVGADDDEQDRLDRDQLFNVLEEEVMQRYYSDKSRWIDMMENSIAMSRWRFSSDRMLQDYYEQLYSVDFAESVESDRSEAAASN